MKEKGRERETERRECFSGRNAESGMRQMRKIARKMNEEDKEKIRVCLCLRENEHAYVRMRACTCAYRYQYFVAFT